MFLQELFHGESHYLNSIPYMNGEVILQEHPVRNLRRHGQTIRTVSRGVLSLGDLGSPEMFLQEHNASFAYSWRVLSGREGNRQRGKASHERDEVFLQEHCGKLVIWRHGRGVGIAIMRSNSTYLAVDRFIVARW